MIGRQPLKMPTNSTAINRMAEAVDILRRLDFDRSQFDVRFDASGIHVTGKAMAGTGAILSGSFLCTLSGSIVSVRAGTFRLHGIGNYLCNATTITLTGDPDWVYAFHMRDHSSSGIDHMASEPTSDTNTIRVPLARYDMGSTGSYVLGETLHLFDVQFDMPIR